MTFSEESTRQVIPSPSRAAGVPESLINPPFSSNALQPTHNILNPVQTNTLLDENASALPDEQTLALEQLRHSHDLVDGPCAYLRDLLAGRFICRPNQICEFPMSELSFHQLINDPEFESLREELKLKISYDKSVLAIFPMPSIRHSCVVDWVNDVAKLAIQGLNPCIREKFGVASNQDSNDFHGDWNGCLRAPDFVIEWDDDDGGSEPHTIIEVNCSKSRDSRLKIVNTYLKGALQISRVILIDITEIPKYRQPKNMDINELKDIQKRELQCESDEGPVSYKGHQWIGHTTISWEVWERNQTNGEPEQMFQATLIPADGGSTIPFFEIPATIAPGVAAVEIKGADIDHLWHKVLKKKIINEAMLRIREYVHQKTRRANDAAKIAKQKDQAHRQRKKANEERARRSQRRQSGKESKPTS